MQERFTETNFTAILLREFQKHGIYDFSQRELEKELYYYQNVPKYRPLFLDIDCRYNKVNLSESFGYYYIFGDMYSINPDFDHKYINLTADYYIAKEELKDYENLMIEMINEYVLRKKVASESIINLKIHGLNPNIQYNLVRGTSLNELIEWNVITDGDINVVREENREYIKHVFWPYPNLYRDEDMSKLEDVDATCIAVNNATFAIRQGRINNQVVSAEILTEILDEEKLSQMANFALLEESLEQPLVRVRKQK